MGWQVTVGDLVLNEEELTAAEATAIAERVGGGWDSIHPLHSPASAVAVVHTLLVVRCGSPSEAAWLAVNAMPAGDLLACVTRV